jgi:hypothetical protein
MADNPANDFLTARREAAAGLRLWGEFAILAILIVIGVWFGGQGAAPGDSTTGLVLSLCAGLLLLLRLKYRLDGASPGWGNFMLVDNLTNLILVIVLFALLALVGLFVAAGDPTGSWHDAGVALFVVCGILVLLHIKHVFDAAETRG